MTATGVLKTADGAGRFELESATVGGIPIPKVFLQEIVSYYSQVTGEGRTASASTIPSRCPPASAKSRSKPGRPSSSSNDS